MLLSVHEAVIKQPPIRTASKLNKCFIIKSLKDVHDYCHQALLEVEPTLVQSPVLSPILVSVPLLQLTVWQIASFSSHFASFTVGLAYFFFFGFILFVVILFFGICVIIRDKSSDYRHWSVRMKLFNECQLVITWCQKVRRARTVGLERHDGSLSTLPRWAFNATLTGFQPCGRGLSRPVVALQLPNRAAGEEY